MKLKSLKFGIVLVCTLLLIGCVGYYWLGFQTAKAQFAGIGDAMPKGNEINMAYTVIIDTNTTHYFYGNCSTWSWTMISSNATSVINSALGNMTSGGICYFKQGHYPAQNLVVKYDNTTVVGESWNTVIQPPDSYKDTFHIERPTSSAINSTSNLVFRNLYLKGHGTGSSGNGINNIWSNVFTTGFLPNTNKWINTITVDHVKFTDYKINKACINLRNPDNKVLVKECWFQSVNGIDIYLESSGHPSGNIDLKDNSHIHGTPQYGIVINVTNSNIRRVNIDYNNMAFSNTSTATAILFQNWGVGLADCYNVFGNSIEDSKIGIDVGGSSTGIIRSTDIYMNHIWNRNATTIGATGVRMGVNSSATTLRDSYFEGKAGNGWTAITDLNTNNVPNMIDNCNFKTVDTHYSTCNQTLFPVITNFWWSTGANTIANAKSYWMGWGAAGQTSNNLYYVAPTSGLLKFIYAASGATPSAGQTFTYIIQVNAANSTSLVSTSTSAYDMTTVCTISAGDKIGCIINTSATATTTSHRVSVLFVKG